MKSVILVIMLQLLCCGGGLSTGSVDTSVEDSADAGENADSGVVSKCAKACQRFQFTECLSELMQVLPVGEALYTSSCLDRCRELLIIYQNLPYEEVDLECLREAAECSGVLVCFGV